MQSNKSWGRAFRAALPVTLPVLTGYFVIGLAYGILMATKGYGPLWAMAFSVFCHCGSMQFVAIPFLVGKFQPLYVFLLSLMVNARHLFYGISMLDKYKGSGKLKAALVYWLCDETFAINSAAEVPENVDRIQFYTATTMLNVSYWALSALLGGIIGSLITFNTAGLDFALTALFACLFIEQIKDKGSGISAAIGVFATVIALLAFGADNLIIPAMVIILVSLLAGRKALGEKSVAEDTDAERSGL